MAQQVKFIKVQTYAKYVSAVKTHQTAIVFGEFANAAAITDASAADVEGNPINLPVKCGFPVGTKLIYANGIQYDVTNLAKFNGIDSSINYLDSSLATLYNIVNELNIDLGQDYLDLSTNIHDLSTYVHTTVDGSISDISTKLINVSSRLSEVSTRLSDVSTKTNDLSTYVHRTVDVSISDISTRLSNVSTRLSGALKNASIYAEAGTDSSVKITLVTNTVGNSSLSTDFKVNGSEYVNVQHTNGAVSVSLQNITNSVNDINTNSNKLVKADDLYDYVTTQINNLEGALQFKDGVDASTLNKLADPSTGDVYVATGEFLFNGHNVESGDLLIYGKNEWVIVERNLDGAVEASDELDVDHVVVGDGNQTVKTTDFVLPTVDDSTGIRTAEPNSSVLTTEYAVRDYVDNELSAKVADVKVSANTGTPTYVGVDVDPTGRDISVGVKTASLADFADLTYTEGKWVAASGEIQPDGLATAGDVARTIQDNELVVAAALNTFKDKVGLANDLTIQWQGKYEDGTSIVEAIKNINVAGDIQTAIEGLDSSVVATPGKVLTKVVQENGELTAKTEATLKINGVSFTGSSTEISAEIDANDIKLMTDSEANADGAGKEGNPTIKEAIFNLRGGKIGSIHTGNNATVTDANSMELTSAFTKHNIDNEYNLTQSTKDASILTELLVTKTTKTTATALATDAYVQEQIETAVAGALCWEEF